MSEEDSDDAPDMDDEDACPVPPSKIANEKLERVVKRPRACNDTIDTDALKEDLRPLLDKVTKPICMDFRIYGAALRTGGQGIYIFKGSTFSMTVGGLEIGQGQ